MAQSNEGALEYLIPTIFTSSVPPADPDLFCLGDSVPHTSGLPQLLPCAEQVNILPPILKIGFRQVRNVPSALHLNHTPSVFEVTFPSNDGETNTDAVSL